MSKERRAEWGERRRQADEARGGEAGWNVRRVGRGGGGRGGEARGRLHWSPPPKFGKNQRQTSKRYETYLVKRFKTYFIETP